MTPQEGLIWLAERGEWRGADHLLSESRTAAIDGKVGRRGRRVSMVAVIAVVGALVAAIALWPRSEEGGYAVRTGPTSSGVTRTTTVPDPSTTEGPLIEVDSEEGRRLLAEAQDRFELAPGASYPDQVSDASSLFVTPEAFDQYAAWGAACSWYVYLEDALEAGDAVRAGSAMAQLEEMADFEDPAGVGYQLSLIRVQDGTRALRQIIAANCEPVP